MFNDIVARWPEVGSRLDYWETGSPEPILDDVTAVVFMLQDPLRELYPECYADCVAVADRARELGARIVNAPQSLSNTIKTNQAELWRESGLETPPCLLFNSPDDLYRAGNQVGFPAIIKANTLHAQKETLVIENAEGLKAIPQDQIPTPGSISPLVDTRAGYTKSDPTSPYATHFHKKRAMVFGDRVQNNHVFFSTTPVVGCMSSTFGHFRSMNPIKRTLRNFQVQSHIQSDIDFHFSNPDDAETLVTAARVLGVEFCAIDYSIHADGRMVLWEANPFFSLHRWPISVLSGPRRLRERTSRIHETAAQFFRDLLSTAS
jgi:hypothetical protein